jgi:hypothetical protein
MCAAPWPIISVGSVNGAVLQSKNSTVSRDGLRLER